MTPQIQPVPPLIEYLKSVDTPKRANAIEALHLRPNADGPVSFRRAISTKVGD